MAARAGSAATPAPWLGPHLLAAVRDYAAGIVIDTDAGPGTGAGGTWWDVAVPEVSTRREVNEARKGYEAGTKAQWLVN